MKYSFEKLLFTKKRKRYEPNKVSLPPKRDHDNDLEDEALQLINALMSSPYPAENDKISEFYSKVRQRSEQEVGSASEWFDRITSSNQ
ncbi:MAG: hypothetical protein U5K71_13495 [Gracilimonas sp.]|nr:hypothetical protein [Gracilimonas sp.]